MYVDSAHARDASASARLASAGGNESFTFASTEEVLADALDEELSQLLGAAASAAESAAAAPSSDEAPAEAEEEDEEEEEEGGFDGLGSLFG